MTDLAPESQALIRAYRMCFGSPDGQMVLNDLMKHCKFRSEMQNNFDEGARRVFLRILQFSQLSDEQLLALYAGRTIHQPEERQDD